MGVAHRRCAQSEAEAQCAELVKKGVVWATATEDMDALTFGSVAAAASPDLQRDARKAPIVEIDLATALKRAGAQSMDEFIDLCILLRLRLYAGSITRHRAGTQR